MLLPVVLVPKMETVSVLDVGGSADKLLCCFHAWFGPEHFQAFLGLEVVDPAHFDVLAVDAETHSIDGRVCAVHQRPVVLDLQTEHFQGISAHFPDSHVKVSGVVAEQVNVIHEDDDILDQIDPLAAPGFEAFLSHVVI